MNHLNQKFPTICQTIQKNGGGGGQILPPVGNEISSFQNDETVETNACLEMNAEKNRGDDLEGALFTLLTELLLAMRRNYRDALQRRKPHRYKKK